MDMKKIGNLDGRNSYDRDLLDGTPEEQIKCLGNTNKKTNQRRGREVGLSAHTKRKTCDNAK